MATLTINFQANTTGDHYVGYREIHMDPPNTYTVITVNVLTPGLQSAVINIDGSLYCGDLHYSGYIIADCQNQTDSNTDGIPDTAITWSQTIAAQVDPCVLTTFTCSNVAVQSIDLNIVGNGYPGGPNAPVTVTIDAPTAPGGVQATATATTGAGVLASISIDAGGSGYAEADGIQTNIPILRVGQLATNGTGATVDVTFTGGVVTLVTLNTPGTGYTTADRALGVGITIDNTALAVGTPPSVEATFNIVATPARYADNVYEPSITITNPGSGYEVVPNVTFTTTSGTPATGTVELDECPLLDLTDYACVNIDNTSVLPDPSLTAFELGDEYDMCVDVDELVSLPSEWSTAAAGNCKCKGCETVTFDASLATSGSAVIMYNKCWDEGVGETLVVRDIAFGQTLTDIDNIIPETLIIQNDTLDSPIVVTYS
jgi:hypothetical protein